MLVQVLHLVEECAEDLGKECLSVGSYLVSGQEDLDVRKVLPRDTRLIGLDMRNGPGVDVVADAKAMPFPDERFDSVLCLETLEHVDWPRDVFREMGRVLKPFGFLVVTTCFQHPVHDFPSDYWRFTDSALSLLAKDSGFDPIEIQYVKLGEATYVWMLARKTHG